MQKIKEMRFNFKLKKIEKIPLSEIATATAKTIHGLLGENNKWHDLERKPFTCSFINGGKLVDGVVIFKEDANININTENEEVINQIMSSGLDFSIENTKVFKGYNLLSVKNVVYNSNDKKNWITEENKDAFVSHVKNKYALKEVEILKMKKSLITYKNGKKIPVTDLLIRCHSDQNVENLFETGIGGSCSLGFGFVKQIYKSEE